MLPHESIVYFGDSGRTPYGPKPLDVIHRYSNEIIDVLLEQDVKMIVVGCNSASAALEQLGRPKLGVPMVTVIDPPAQTAARLTRNKRVGIIGTEATIGSRQYEEALVRTGQPLQIFAKACPDFVELAERGETTGHQDDRGGRGVPPGAEGRRRRHARSSAARTTRCSRRRSST